MRANRPKSVIAVIETNSKNQLFIVEYSSKVVQDHGSLL
jgi:hypothetical protein